MDGIPLTSNKSDTAPAVGDTARFAEPCNPHDVVSPTDFGAHNGHAAAALILIGVSFVNKLGMEGSPVSPSRSAPRSAVSDRALTRRSIWGARDAALDGLAILAARHAARLRLET